MKHPLIYQAIKQRFLECRQACLEGKLSAEEEGLAFDLLEDSLREQHDPEAVTEAIETFDSDLALMQRAERYDWLGWIATACGFILAYFIDEEDILRATRLNDEVIALDVAFAESGGRE
jgi:hypothetical protein